MDLDRLTPVEAALQRRKRWRLVIILLVVVLAVYYFVFQRTYVLAFDEEIDHFRYGSIGSEWSGLPYWVFRALPEMFPEKFGNQGYRAFGLLYASKDDDLPIGFSRRVIKGVERVWLNCSVCHVGTVTDPVTSNRWLIDGAPSNNLRLGEFINVLREVGASPDFTADKLVDAVNAVGGDLNLFEEAVYRFVIADRVRDELLAINEQLSFMDRAHPWGPGRVDTFNPYKAIQFNFPMGREHLSDVELNGASDYPSIWAQAPREGMQLHWDGNNPSVQERNLSAALGAGVTPVTVDRRSLRRIERWMRCLPPPPYPWKIDQSLADVGEVLYRQHCADCHGAGGGATYSSYAEECAYDDGHSRGYDANAEPVVESAYARYVPSWEYAGYDYSMDRYQRIGRVEELARIGTDPGRWASYTENFAAAQNLLYAGNDWRFSHFRKTPGYANHPLDGIWARSPYLHNGSVPTLWDLLEPPTQRPAIWYRGSDEYDLVRVGYRTHEQSGYFRYDTSVTGNSNAGHVYGTYLHDDEKGALVEYMKTL